MMIIRHLSIDCAYINKVLEPITQREHGVTEFEIEIKNHGADIDLSECTLATYYGLKPDEHKVGVECRVDKDKSLIYLPLYLQMTTAEGVLKGIVELQFPEGNVRFSGVNFKVSFAPDDTKIESTDDFNVLENFISKPTTDGVVGQGVVNITDNTSYNCSSLTGSTAALGNATGQATSTVNEVGGTETAYTSAGRLSVSYRGVENPWGNIWKNIQGVNVWGDGSMGGGQPYIANNFTFNELKHSDNYEPVGFTLPNGNGYIKAMGYGSEKYDWLLMPSEIGGTSALPVGDYLYVASNLNGYRIVRFGGGYSSVSNAGSFSWVCDSIVNYHYRILGGRLIYVPIAKV